MTVCETCWEAAAQDALLLGGTVADHYHRRIAETGAMPDHALPPREEASDADDN